QTSKGTSRPAPLVVMLAEARP
ncbi:MAG: hypothetical protein QOH66_1644, partial [Actinomycetota bacterium]|nr:hypothetical protein [Actinomycetota bacterium]